MWQSSWASAVPCSDLHPLVPERPFSHLLQCLTPKGLELLCPQRDNPLPQGLAGGPLWLFQCVHMPRTPAGTRREPCI